MIERSSESTTSVRFLLFVAGESPSSKRAIGNLESALHAHHMDPTAAEIVDVFKEPQRALAYRIFATPVLTLQANPGAVLYGDLSDTEAVRRFLESSR